MPTVEGWNVTAQRELTNSLSLQVAYVASQAYHNMFDSSPFITRMRIPIAASTR